MKIEGEEENHRNKLIEDQPNNSSYNPVKQQIMHNSSKKTEPTINQQ